MKMKNLTGKDGDNMSLALLCKIAGALLGWSIGVWTAYGI